MPNNLVFNHVADDLKVQIYGLYSGAATAIAVDASGNMLVAGTFTLSGGAISATITGGTIDALLAGTVTVNGGTIDQILAGTIDALQAGTVTVSGGTIDQILAGTIDALQAGTVTVSGGTIDALQAGTVTVNGGTIQTMPIFSSDSATADVGTTTVSLLVEDTSTQKVYSYWVVNLDAAETLYAWLEIAPVNADTYYVSDSSGTFTIGPTSMDVLVAKEFLNYTRLRLAATDTSSVECHYNAQT